MVEMQTADRVLVLQIGKEQQRSLFVDRFTAVFSICFSFGRLSCPTSVLLLHTHPLVTYQVKWDMGVWEKFICLYCDLTDESSINFKTLEVSISWIFFERF